VHVTVRLFARLRELVGAGELRREVSTPATLAGVWRDLVRDWPALEPYTQSISAARNEEYAPMGTAVADGDELAFLPPVSGGRDRGPAR
jgi:molybdopterin converting factor small subunit